MSDWLGSLAQVAGVAGQLISAFLSDEAGADSTAATGDVEWTYVQQAGKSPLVYARNTSSLPVGLTYTLARENQNLSVHQPLDPGNSYDATADIEQFLDGNVAALPSAPDAGTDAGTGGARTVSMAISLLAIGTTVAIVRGVTFSYSRTPTGFTASLKSDAAAPISAQVSARDQSGNAVSAKFRIGGASADGGIYEVELPPGVDLDPVADHIDLLLELPVAAYEAATRERSQRQIAPAAAAV